MTKPPSPFLLHPFDLHAKLYDSEFFPPTTAPDEALMALTNLTKRRFAHCGRKRRVWPWPLLRRLAVTRRVREPYLAICSTTVSSEARPRFVRFGGRFVGRCFVGEGGVIFGFHTERPLVVIRPRPGPPTYDLDLRAADRRAAAEARRVDFV